MEINGIEIDFSKQRGYFFHMDCMDALKQMPDKSVSLAIVDPPYGAGFTEGGGCQGWFSKYHQSEEKSSQFCKVERERERESKANWNRFGGRFDRYKHTLPLGCENGTEIINRNCKRQENNAKKSFRGTQPREKNTFKNFSVSHGIR